MNNRIEGANVDHAGFSNALLNSAEESVERQQGGDREIEKHGGEMRKCTSSTEKKIGRQKEW